MTTVTDNDLKRVEDKIDKLSEKFDKITETINQLAIGQVEIKTELREKLNSVNTRLDRRVNCSKPLSALNLSSELIAQACPRESGGQLKLTGKMLTWFLN